MQSNKDIKACTLNNWVSEFADEKDPITCRELPFDEVGRNETQKLEKKEMFSYFEPSKQEKDANNEKNKVKTTKAKRRLNDSLMLSRNTPLLMNPSEGYSSVRPT